MTLSSRGNDATLSKWKRRFKSGQSHLAQMLTTEICALWMEVAGKPLKTPANTGNVG